MSDLIRRSDAIEAIEGVDWYHQNSRNKDMVNGANSDEHQAWYKADDVYEALKEVPSADLNAEFAEWAKLWFKKELEADRPRGEWIGYDSMKDKFDDIRCSCCQRLFTVDAYHFTDIGFTKDDLKFCPNCGARMKGADRKTEPQIHGLFREDELSDDDVKELKKQIGQIIEYADRKTESDSEKPNNCKYAENPSGDVWECGCFLDTYCEHQIYDRNPDGTINIVKCGYEPKDEPTTEDCSTVDKDINVRSKDEPKLSEIPTSKCHYEPKDEPQERSE